MQEEDIRTVLSTMEKDPLCVTESAYRADAVKFLGNRISFTDLHLAYIKAHPALDPQHYLSNLKLQIKKRV